MTGFELYTTYSGIRRVERAKPLMGGPIVQSPYERRLSGEQCVRCVAKAASLTTGQQAGVKLPAAPCAGVNLATRSARRFHSSARCGGARAAAAAADGAAERPRTPGSARDGRPRRSAATRPGPLDLISDRPSAKAMRMAPAKGAEASGEVCAPHPATMPPKHNRECKQLLQRVPSRAGFGGARRIQGEMTAAGRAAQAPGQDREKCNSAMAAGCVSAGRPRKP